REPPSGAPRMANARCRSGTHPEHRSVERRQATRVTKDHPFGCVLAGRLRIMRIAALLLTLAACSGERFRPIDPGPFERARAACGPEADPLLFVYQAESGECRVDPSRFERRTDRLAIEVRGG